MISLVEVQGFRKANLNPHYTYKRAGQKTSCFLAQPFYFWDFLDSHLSRVLPILPTVRQWLPDDAMIQQCDDSTRIIA